MMVTRLLGEVGKNRENYCLMGKAEFLFFKVKRVLEMDGGDGYTIMNILKALNFTIKMVEMVSFMLFMFYCQKMPIDGMRK